MSVDMTALFANPIVDCSSNYVDALTLRSSMDEGAIETLLAVKSSPMAAYSGLIGKALAAAGDSAMGFDSRLDAGSLPIRPLAVLSTGVFKGDDVLAGHSGYFVDLAVMALEHLDPDDSIVGWDRACVLHLQADIADKDPASTMRWFMTFDRFNPLYAHPSCRKGVADRGSGAVESFLSDPDVARWLAYGVLPPNSRTADANF